MKTKILLFVIFISVTSVAQRKDKQWYYFQYPVSDVFGIAYNKPKNNTDISAVGASKFEVLEKDLIVQKGPDEFYASKNKLSDLVLSSLFQKRKNVKVIVEAYKLKRVTLDGNKWKKFNRDNYYITEAIKADSVTITITVTDTTKADSKAAQEIIKKMASTGTAAIDVIDAMTGEKTENEKNKGIVTYSSAKNDSISIIIKDPEIYFAAKFVQIQSNAIKDRHRPPISFGYSMKRDKDKESFSLKNKELKIVEADLGNIYQNGAKLILKAELDEKQKKLNLNLYSQITGEDEIKTEIKSKVFDESDDGLSFEGEYPFLSEPMSQGKASAQKILTLIDYKLEYNPKEKTIILYGYQDKTYQTCIYQIESSINYWPK